MTLDWERELLQVLADIGGFYNGNPANLVLSGVRRENGQTAADLWIRDLNPEPMFGLGSGMRFQGASRPLGAADRSDRQERSAPITRRLNSPQTRNPHHLAGGCRTIINQEPGV